MYQEIVLDIRGHGGRPVPNLFLKQEAQTDDLAIILPGFGYNADLPLLNYPGRMVLSLGMDLLRLETAYNRRPEFTGSSGPERRAWLDDDTDAAFDAAFSQRPYRKLFFIGKSLGTQAMGRLLERQPQLPPSYWIWLTPLLTDKRMVDQIRQKRPHSLFVIGTADDLYDAAVLKTLVDATQGKQVVIEDANHGMEIAGSSIQKSIQVLGEIMAEVEEFITSSR